MVDTELLVRERPEDFVAHEISVAMQRAVDERGRCLLVLSGGSTPLPVYGQLKRMEDLPWSTTHLFWADERFVPPDHESSNRLAVERTLLDGVDLPKSQVHPWPILSTPEESAVSYAGDLRRVAGDPVTFDVTLLGLGADCHTASLFPGTGAVDAPGLTTSSRPAGVDEARLSLTATALSNSRLVIFLVTGDEKRRALQSLLAQIGSARPGSAKPESTHPADCPARSISALERLLVVTDQQLDR